MAEPPHPLGPSRSVAVILILRDISHLTIGVRKREQHFSAKKISPCLFHATKVLEPVSWRVELGLGTAVQEKANDGYNMKGPEPKNTPASVPDPLAPFIPLTLSLVQDGLSLLAPPAENPSALSTNPCPKWSRPLSFPILSRDHYPSVQSPRSMVTRKSLRSRTLFTRIRATLALS